MPSRRTLLVIAATSFCALIGAFLLINYQRVIVVDSANPGITKATKSAATIPPAPQLDKVAYDKKLLEIANLHIVTHVAKIPNSTSTITTTSTTPLGWPVKTVYPNFGALLPANRIVAYYGNLYSTQMGVLGEYPKEQVLQMLASTTKQWQDADPGTHTIPALDYIAVSAQGSAGFDSKYRARMPYDQIDQILEMAKQIDGIVFLDLQIGLSNVQAEIPLLEKYLKLPQVHLSLDPEFAMHNGQRPGTVIGTMDAADVNYAASYLANLVRENNLPPKILVVHRFTEAMVTNSQNITPLPEVQVVMDMDGYGGSAQKVKTYLDTIQSEPVQFTGFKLFYKNDIRADHLMTPEEVLRLSPRPSYIQYQ